MLILSYDYKFSFTYKVNSFSYNIGYASGEPKGISKMAAGRVAEQRGFTNVIRIVNSVSYRD